MKVILIVDDNPTNLRTLGELLRPFYRVRLADSGAEALRIAGSGTPPDLILLDVMMPGMDGYEVLHKLQADEATRHVPVIFVTALHDEDSELRGFELGAADFIHKPVRAAIALSRIRAQLDAKAARDSLRTSNRSIVSQMEEGARQLELAQMQLLQSEKMASIGQLSAGIAHEINNPIGFVASNLSTLAQYLQDLLTVAGLCADDPGSRDASAILAEVRAQLRRMDFDFLRQDVADLVAETREGVERVRRIVADLKGFSHSGDSEWQWADLHAGLDSTLNIARNEFKYHCTLVKDYGELPHVRCIPSQLNQVFMNLVVNAAQAIEGEGQIAVRTACTGDNGVEISVTDTGAGIDADKLPRIFEPFYTTKPVGKGTGLGLSLSWGIVERHGGTIRVFSEPGKGTTFTVNLPIDGPPATHDDAP
ncbi:ATP-binding protein [Zoogloea sp.]|uniref:ATP-binding protein n=1 Tax=Zoogloea sp. TaxID=49181 RepID=UPI0035AFDB40